MVNWIHQHIPHLVAMWYVYNSLISLAPVPKNGQKGYKSLLVLAHLLAGNFDRLLKLLTKKGVDMSTAPTVDLQAELTAVEKVAEAASAPFIKNPTSQAKVQTIAGEVNLGIAALPLFASLFQTVANLFHHAHAAATVAPPADTTTK